MRKMNEKSCTRRSSGAWFYVHGFAIAVLILCGLGNSAWAQVPFVPDDWKFGKRQDSNTLHYCVDARDPDLHHSGCRHGQFSRESVFRKTGAGVGGRSVGHGDGKSRVESMVLAFRAPPVYFRFIITV